MCVYVCERLLHLMNPAFWDSASGSFPHSGSLWEIAPGNGKLRGVRKDTAKSLIFRNMSSK